MANNHIIIGLGGTGGNVIKDFRKQIIDKYGTLDVPEVSNIEYLYVDSKKSEFDEQEWQYQGKDIGLGLNGILLLQAGRLDEILNTQPRPAFVGKKEDWGGIISDKALVGKAGNQIRRLGRVNFSYSVDDFTERVISKVKKLGNNKVADTEVHIVVGLAGGTGSGSVVDATNKLLLKLQHGAISNVQVKLYLKLPELDVPSKYTGGYFGKYEGVSFYKLNGYAALKEINALSNGVFVPYDISEIRKRENSENKLTTAYLFTEKNNKDIQFNDPGLVTNAIASLLYLKSITLNSYKDVKDAIDKAENQTLVPEYNFELNWNYPSAGVYKLGVPKTQIDDYLSVKLLLQAFDKLLYSNHKDDGSAYIGKYDQSVAQKEINEILTFKRTQLLREWYLEYDFLILDEPMRDMKSQNQPAWGLMHAEVDDVSFNQEFEKCLEVNVQRIIVNNLYQGSQITDREKLGYLKMAINDFFNTKYKGVGYERYVAKMQENRKKLADFIALRIKNKMFGNDSGFTRFYPLKSYSDIITTIIQGYFDQIEKDLVRDRTINESIVNTKAKELVVIEKDFVDSFGLIGNKNKREKAIATFKASIEEYWRAIVKLQGIEFASQFIRAELTNSLKDIHEEIEENVNYAELKRDANNYLKRLFLGEDKSGRFKSELARLERLIIDNKDRIFSAIQTRETSDNKSEPLNILDDLVFLRKDLNEIIKSLFDPNTFRELGISDTFYNAHIIDVLYDKFNGDIKNAQLRDLFDDMVIRSAPMAKYRNKGKSSKGKALVVITEMLGVSEGEDKKLKFYNQLVDYMKNKFETDDTQVVVLKEAVLKSEITFAQFRYLEFPDNFESIFQLKKVYDKYNNNHEIMFLMHSEDVSHLPELTPPVGNEGKDFKDAIFPYLMVLDASNAFEEEGFYRSGKGEDFWRIKEKVNLSRAISSHSDVSSESDAPSIVIPLGAKSIEDFYVKVDLDKLNDEFPEDGNVKYFVSSPVYFAFRKKAKNILKNADKVELVKQKITRMTEDILIEVGNNENHPKYQRYQKARTRVFEIINILI
jgi:hypothetical protein